jgi:acetyl esterase/lipase
MSLAAPKITPPSRWPAPDDKAAWRKLASEHDATVGALFAQQPPFEGRIETDFAGDATLFALIPADIEPAKEDRALIYVHGGGFFMGGGTLALKAAQAYASRMKIRTYVPDYRMPPDHPFPAALDDVVATYRHLLTRHAPACMAILGVSAGGGLAASAVLKLRDLGLPMPGATVLLTPEADLTESGDSFETNKFLDIVLVDRLTESVLLYADGHNLQDPYLSPIFGDFSQGFPPTLLVSGTRDLFLSNTVRLHRALRRAGVEADLHVFEAMPHGGFFGAPEDDESMDEQVRFVERALG